MAAGPDPTGTVGRIVAFPPRCICAKGLGWLPDDDRCCAVRVERNRKQVGKKRVRARIAEASLAAALHLEISE